VKNTEIIEQQQTKTKMKEFKENTDRNELEIHIVGTSASGKSTIQLIIAEALKDKGFNVKINSSDHESEDDFFDTYKNNQELRESSVLKLNDLITINEVQALKTFKTKTKKMGNGRIYDKEKLKKEYSKLVEAYKDRTDLDIQHPTPKLKWWQKLIGAFKGRRY
jgi:ABC-type dipeptide/oligopeptide/nickel transport system ATPase subunit